MKRNPTKTLPPLERLHELLSIDNETGLLLWKPRPVVGYWTVSWNNRCAGKPAGSFQSSGHRRVHIDDVPYLEHRLIWKMTRGEEPPAEVDHLNRNPAANHPSNLRPATRTTNARNIARNASNTSGYKGVSFCKQTQKWKVQIRVGDGKTRTLGRYSDIKEAADAYQMAALKAFGEFATF